MAGLLGVDDPAGYALDAGGVSDAGAAVLLDDERHRTGFYRPGKKRGLRLAPTDFEDAVARDTLSGRRSQAAERRWARLDALLEELGGSTAPLGQDVATWLAARGWGTGRVDAWAAQVEITQEYGRDPGALGVRATQEGDEYRGGDAMVVGGYVRIPETLLTGVDVRLSSPVTAVTADRSGVAVSLADGSLERADAAVVAVPLEVLRAGAITVTPMPREVRPRPGSAAAPGTSRRWSCATPSRGGVTRR